ncbi:anthranilate synthase component I family protein [Caulobacter mirabilis]|uniref:Aminodeoxychorismate synthase component I n=1 Tax=Caulobacter mirabilis TaxID=69666 RepID=A0A2D2ASK2_9CAUL|nr:anthranilate synthase component I family protein [Caulobacter mirabilis]ATQ40945.1 aminodeoxychorismate synthase component I [Caulobacter mirabilis]
MRTPTLLERPWRAPEDVLAAFADEPWSCAFLSGGGGARGRWSYVLRAPDATLTIAPSETADPFDAMTALLGPRRPSHPEGPPFQGGLAGLAAYELGDRIERLGLGRHPDWPDLALGRYPALLAFDHEMRRVVAVGEDAAGAEGAANWLSAPSRPAVQGRAAEVLDPPTSAQAYEAAVADVVARIHAGEYFQANIARRWTGRLADGVDPLDLLLRLVADSPAPFAAWLGLEDRALVSNSPERFVQVEAGRTLAVETRPIKGTRPRGRDPAADAGLARDLAASAKDRAENLMIVDLMRNDLSRVSVPGRVTTPELFAVESFANVHHLVSTVRAELAPGLGAIDLLRAAFPPGSVTGAPKVQAMKSIARLEPPRGPYCGSMLWAGFDGAFDSSVLIRTLACARAKDGHWDFEARAGAGIVADSDPLAERLETEDKIAALLRALTETT